MPKHETKLAHDHELTVSIMYQSSIYDLDGCFPSKTYSIDFEIFACICLYIYLADGETAYLVDVYVSRGMSELLNGKVMVKLCLS
jgi:hypothetical protein